MVYLSFFRLKFLNQIYINYMINLIGKNINNYYLIREKILEDSISTWWLSHSIFTIKKFIIRIFKQNAIDSNQKKNLLKKEYSSTKLIYDYNILNYLEIDEFENKIFISVEVKEGESLSSYLNKNKIIEKNNLIKILIETANIINNFHKNDQVINFFSFNDFWIESTYDHVQSVSFINFQYRTLNNFLEIKEINEIKKFLILDENNKKIITAQSNDFILFGILFYVILSKDFDLNKLNPDINHNQLNNTILNIENKSKYIKILLKSINKNNGYKNIKELLTELYNLEKNIKNINKVNNGKEQLINYDSIFEERRNYFEKLEMERKKRLYKSKNYNENQRSNDKSNYNENLEIYNSTLSKKRKNNFEIYKKDKSNYFKKSEKNYSNHKDHLINLTKEYFDNLSTEEHDVQKNSLSEEYFEKISDQMKKHVNKIKSENIKYSEDIIKKNSEKEKNDDSANFFINRILEMKKHFNSLTIKSKKFFLNLVEEVKIQIDKNKLSYSKTKKDKTNNIINHISGYYNKIEKELNKYYNEIIKKNKKRESINPRGIDIVYIQTLEKKERLNLIKIIKNFLYQIYKFIFFHKKSSLDNNKK